MKFVLPAIFVGALPMFGAAELPFLVISDSTQTVAVRQVGQFVQVGKKSNSFTARAWAEKLGVTLQTQDPIGHCDKHGCSAE